jgi:hypothetical protein
MTNPGLFQSQSSLASDGRGRDRIVRDEAGLVSTAPVEERAILVPKRWHIVEGRRFLVEARIVSL